MKIIFMGTPAFSVQALEKIINAGHEVVAVYSQPPRPSGRGMALHNSPVHDLALKHNIPVFIPKSLKNLESQEQFAKHNAELAVVAAYGLLLPKPVLDTCRSINIHASLLPRWRGAAPIQRAIMAGDKKTGITIMNMDEGLDTGDMLLIKEVDITDTMTAGQLHDELSAIGAKLVVEAIAKIANGALHGTKQHGEITYAAKIMKQEAKIDWNLPAAQIILNIRAFNPFPGAYFEYEGEKIKILEAHCECDSKPRTTGIILDEKFSIACADGIIMPMLVQRQGKKVMSVPEMLRGFKISAGAMVG